MLFLHKMPAVIRWIYPRLTWKKKVDDKIIHLTFDDGPVPGLTEEILDILHNYNVKASFFCVGENLKKHPGIAQRALDEGHRLGNHTFNHLNGWSTNVIDYVSNVALCQKQLLDLKEKRAPLFRPPYGKIKRNQINQLTQRYKIIMWDVLSGDFLSSITPEKCLRNTIKATSPGSIVLFHDNPKASKNVTYALPRYIEHFKKEGYSFNLL